MNYYYLDVSLEFETGQSHNLSTVAFFKKHVMQSMKILFGEIAASVTVDVLKYNPDNHRAILRVPADYYVKLHSALTLRGDYQGIPCAYRIHKTSPVLIALSADSRTYKHS